MVMESYLRGETPSVRVHRADLAQQERDKYAGVWNDIPQYAENSPGLAALDSFLAVAQPRLGTTILDIGCGQGLAGLKLADMGFVVSYLDVTGAALDPKVDRKRFLEQSLWKPVPMGMYWECGFCCDVMEHLPIEYTMLAVSNLMRACGLVWFQIALTHDQFGQALGSPLHLTVQEFTWWRDRLGTIAKLVDARDLGGKATFVLVRR